MLRYKNVHISHFRHGSALYVHVHQPPNLVQQIQSFCLELYYYRQSHPGVCTISEFWYIITDERQHHMFHADGYLLGYTKCILSSYISRQQQDKDFMRTLSIAIAGPNAYVWARRYV